MQESHYHTLLILTKQLKVGTRKSNKELRDLLQDSSFEDIYNSFPTPLDEDTLKSKLKDDNFSILTINDDNFPQSLRDNPEATPVLYYQGNIELFNNPSIAVVGTRQLKDMVDIEEGKKIVARLVNKGYTIVSGLAEGCDTLAHEQAIALGGTTIAVLGTPLDRFYPRQNRSLQENIARDHLLVSEYPTSIRTFPSYFANRNLTTVTLSSEGVVVIRSPDKSGTQHAVRECIKQDKPLYVLANNFGQGYEWTRRHRDHIKVPNRQ